MRFRLWHPTNPYFHHNWEEEVTFSTLGTSELLRGRRDVASAYIFPKCVINNSGPRQCAPAPIRKQENEQGLLSQDAQHHAPRALLQSRQTRASQRPQAPTCGCQESASWLQPQTFSPRCRDLTCTSWWLQSTEGNGLFFRLTACLLSLPK